MRTRLIVATILLSGLSASGPASAQLASSEQEFQQMAAVLRADDAERRSAIAVCIAQGVGASPEGLAEFMGVPVERAAEVWCTRMADGIANGLLTLADVTALSEGTVTPGAQKVLTADPDGK